MSGLQIDVLGPLRIGRNGTAVTVPGAKPRALLVTLAAAQGFVVSTDQALDALWPAKRPRSALNTLQSYVAVLRRTLEPGRAPGERGSILVREGSGYALRLPVGALDAEEFTRLATRANRQLQAGEAGSAASGSAEALALWRGRPFQDAPDHVDLIAAEVARLHELHVTLLEDRFAAAIVLGQHASVAGELAQHCRDHPLRERGWELLALARYRDGRQADALASLREARRRLAGELGVDPGPRLRELEARILAHDEALFPTDITAGPNGTASHNVPLSLDRTIGRQTEADWLRTMLARYRLTTVTGPGGVGKTRLALDVARTRDDPDGPWVVDVGRLTSGSLLAPAIGRILGLFGANTTEQLTDVLRQRHFLLVLDGCEHLGEAVAELVAALLRRCAGLRVLVTSREPLRVPGEGLLEVRPLRADDDAVELFLDRAGAGTHGWNVRPEDRSVVTRICRRLDGLPLAIELAAARAAALPLPEIEQRLDDRFTLLRDGNRGGEHRHESLWSTLDWSYSMLSASERSLFAALSVFEGGFDTRAVAAVAGPERSAVAATVDLAALVAKSCVVRVRDEEAGPAGDRYGLLDTVRAFASAQLSGAAAASVRARHRAWVEDLTATAERRMVSFDAADSIARLSVERANCRAALASASTDDDPGRALRIVASLGFYWYRTGAIEEGTGSLQQALRFPDRAPEALPRALLFLAGLHYLAGDLRAGLGGLDAAAVAARAVDDRLTLIRATCYRAHFGVLAGENPAEMAAVARRAVAWAERSAPQWVAAEALSALGHVDRLGGDPATALDRLTRAQRLAEECGHDWAAGSAAWAAVKAALDLGRSTRALRLITEQVVAQEIAGDWTSWLVMVHTAAGALAASGRAEDGAMLLGAVTAIGARLGFDPARMDPIDAPRIERLVTDGCTPEVAAAARAAGTELTRTQVRDLLLQAV
ncbi:BTAD domain-containing putative transcriptional regulator [Cryptosporangium aurantiacum]|uniref:Predicted ATPase n=1 Tax=Cryptosporangium aurantiacum TaxID=134849 RepID=A0A1M7RHI5_9ACTN|nr:BTAD domain-containing putative transcriptional regulator [Cryptosporangium aurantiacum]SHN45619.1 Predicted ATPase [Cryptosporangium aurantiacum]